MKRYTTIAELIGAGADDAIAFSAPAALPLSYKALRACMQRTVSALNCLGIGNDDRVAIVLHNGPEMASAFVCIAAGATAAPLNSAYRADEFEFYLSDLHAKALVVEKGSSSPALAIADKLGVQILELTPGPAGAGDFTLAAQKPKAVSTAAVPGLSRPDSIALILHTSGTTSRPKIVPLSQSNVCASACNVRDNLKLTTADIGLNIMPLFHIHGLIAGLLASLSAGSQIFCTPGFNALKFFGWMQ
ncbi:MAG: AMP-binding protein, partial [Gallionellaceae bacterium]